MTHDQVTNFLAQSNFPSKELWMLVKKNVCKIESPEGVVIFDDTIQKKPYTGENEIVCQDM